MRTTPLLLGSAALLILTMRASAAADYLPLTQGMRWRYQGVEGRAETQTIDGTLMVHCFWERRGR